MARATSPWERREKKKVRIDFDVRGRTDSEALLASPFEKCEEDGESDAERVLATVGDEKLKQDGLASSATHHQC